LQSVKRKEEKSIRQVIPALVAAMGLFCIAQFLKAGLQA